MGLALKGLNFLSTLLARDQCENEKCPENKECIHPTYDSIACGCSRECADNVEYACGTNMMTYKNKCYLEKEACESDNSFSYAHPGKCESKYYEGYQLLIYAQRPYFIPHEITRKPKFFWCFQGGMKWEHWLEIS